MTRLRHALVQGVAAAGLLTAIGAVAHPGSSDFLTTCHAAMDRMMRDMDIPRTGDVDRDFVAMMTPHHQGAIDMAIAEIRYGHDERLKRIAQEIIVDQQQEVAAMKLALGDPVRPSAPAPTGNPRSRQDTHQ